MKSKIFLQLIISCFFAFSVAASDAQDAKVWAQEKGELLLSTFNQRDVAEKYRKLDELFLENIDLDHISKFVVGKYWRQMSDEQKNRYQPLFERYSLSVYKSFPLSFANQLDFKIINVLQEKDYVDVFAIVDLGLKQNDGSLPSSINISFRMHKVNGKFKLIDIKLAESSLILSYRNRFYEMIAQNDGDIEWFLEDLQTITESTERTNQIKLQNSQY